MKNDPIIHAPLSKIVEAIKNNEQSIIEYYFSSALINEDRLFEAIASLESSEREVLVNYADWFEDNKHNLVGETIGYVIDRYISEKQSKTEKK